MLSVIAHLTSLAFVAWTVICIGLIGLQGAEGRFLIWLILGLATFVFFLMR